MDSEGLERYRRDGVLFPVPVLAAAEVATYQGALLAAEPRLSDARRIPMPHTAFRWAWELATHPALLDVVEAVLGPELLIAATMVLTKPPGDPALVTWHQDGTSSGLYRTPNTTAWISLWASNAENGCMRVVPGSHRQSLLPHVTSQDANHLLLGSPEVAAEVDEAAAVDVALGPGEMSLHHSNIIHGSNANRSGARRTGFIVRFITPQAETSQRPVIQARGRADCSHLASLPGPPPDDGLEAALARWRAQS